MATKKTTGTNKVSSSGGTKKSAANRVSSMSNDIKFDDKLRTTPTTSENTMSSTSTKINAPVHVKGMMGLGVAGKVEKLGMNILDIDVPEELNKQVPTGIEYMDDLLGGGWTPSTVCLLTGGPGAGKTTLSLELANSMHGGDNIVVYLGTEEAVVQMRKSTIRLGLKNGFIVDDCELMERCPSWKNDNRRCVMDHLRALRAANPTKQIIVICDSLQSHDDGFYYNGTTNSKTQVRVAEQLASWAKSKESGYAVIILIGQVTKNGDFAGPNALKHAIDAHLELKIDTIKDSTTRGKRLLAFSKNRFGCTGACYVLSMTKSGLKEEGLVDG